MNGVQNTHQGRLEIRVDNSTWIPFVRCYIDYRMAIDYFSPICKILGYGKCINSYLSDEVPEVQLRDPKIDYLDCPVDGHKFDDCRVRLWVKETRAKKPSKRCERPRYVYIQCETGGYTVCKKRNLPVN